MQATRITSLESVTLDLRPGATAAYVSYDSSTPYDDVLRTLLTSCPSLAHLDITWYFKSECGVVTDAIARNTSLTSLAVGVPTSYAGVTAFNAINMLAANRTLLSLRVHALDNAWV